jgi:hypothetical protein
MKFITRLILLCSLALSGACTHTAPCDDKGSVDEIAQHISNSGSCDPDVAIESDPQKKKSFQSVRIHCQSEIKKLCHEVECPELMKPMQVCLMTFDQDLSKECIRDLNRHIRAFQPYVKTLDE